MKILKKIVLFLIGTITISTLVVFIYFNQKFTPEKNELAVENESGKIPITWLGNSKNVLLIPIKFPKDNTQYYLQFDTGSPSTIFYKPSIKNLKNIVSDGNIAKTTFFIGNAKISSQKLKIIDFGKEIDNNDSLKIIGTLGTDILEDRKTELNFLENYIDFNLKNIPKKFQNNLFDFKFKKRKIIIPGFLKGKEESFLYDSGSSAFELLTNKEIWNQLKTPNSKINIEKSQSWETTLTTFTANSKNKIIFGNKNILLNEVTYVDGYSQTQYLLMKFSGMTGMLGNKIFIKNTLFLDGKNMKMSIK